MEYQTWNKRRTIDQQKKSMETIGRIEKFEIFVTSVKKTVLKYALWPNAEVIDQCI